MDWNFLTDWKFWSFIVALLALILSQLPPISTWFRRAKLDLDLYSLIYLNHKIGNPNLQVNINLRNSGGRKVLIRTIKVDIKRDAKHIVSLNAQTYLPTPESNQKVILTPFSLKPDEDWSKPLDFLNFFNREESKVYRNAEKKLREKIVELRATQDKNDIAIVDSDTIQPLLDIHKSKFLWFAGDYEVSLSIITDDKKVPRTQ